MVRSEGYFFRVGENALTRGGRICLIVASDDSLCRVLLWNGRDYEYATEESLVYTKGIVSKANC